MATQSATDNQAVMEQAWGIARAYEEEMAYMTPDQRVQFLAGSLAGAIASHNHLVGVVVDMRKALAEHAQVLAGLVMKRSGGAA